MAGKTIEESIISAMEGTDVKLVKYLPYILQDFWEMGSFPEEIIKIIRRYKKNCSKLSVLDLGSGKGAISIKIAAELKCHCLGIDAIEDFVKFSNDKSKEFSVDNICKFETNDIRIRIKTLGKFDIIILSAIGPILGDYYGTLSQLKPHLNNSGMVIIDDAYIEDDYSTDYPDVLRKSDILNQINNAGMELFDKITNDEIPEINGVFENEYKNVEKRCLELVEKYPENKNIFLEYSERQKKFTEQLISEVTPVILVIKQKV
jgi:cyclopropane fatty-acyl-phospholipid synthase-like methyltransferase